MKWEYFVYPVLNWLRHRIADRNITLMRQSVPMNQENVKLEIPYKYCE